MLRYCYLLQLYKYKFAGPQVEQYLLGTQFHGGPYGHDFDIALGWVRPRLQDPGGQLQAG